MKKILLVAAIGAAFLAVGCGGGGGNSTGPAFLRFVHASRDTGGLDITLQDAPLGTITYQGSFPSTGASARQINGGLQSLTVFEADTSNVVFDLAPQFEAGHIYTLIAAGLTSGGPSDDLQTLVVDEPKSSLTAAKSNLQFVNASTLLNSVDIYVTGLTDDISTLSPNVSALGRYGISGLVTVAPGSYRIRVCPNGSKTPTINVTATAVAGTYGVDVTEANGTNTGSVLNDYSGTF